MTDPNNPFDAMMKMGQDWAKSLAQSGVGILHA